MLIFGRWDWRSMIGRSLAKLALIVPSQVGGIVGAVAGVRFDTGSRGLSWILTINTP